MLWGNRTRTRATSTAPMKKVIRGVVAAVGAAALLLGGAVAANAAPPYTTNGTVSDIKFVTDSGVDGQLTQLTANWTLPDNPTSPAGFTIALPPELEGNTDTFTITAQDTGAVIATCVATKTQLECDFDPAYLASHRTNLNGNVYFWVKINDHVDQTETHNYNINGETVPFTINPPAQCTTNCEFEWPLWKGGSYNNDNNTISWWVHIAADKGGMAGGQEVIVHDTPDANQKLLITDTLPTLMRTNQTAPDYSGADRPTNWENVPRTDYTVAPDGTITFTTTAGYYYQVYYATEVLDAGAARDYTNAVTYSVAGTDQGTTTGKVRRAGGGGSGIGDEVGVFTITKAVDGTATNLPADLVFTGKYSVKTPDGQTLEGTYSVTAGTTWRSPEFPKDSVVTLTEDTPTTPSNVTWANPTFSDNGFTLVGGEITAVTLTNSASVKTTKFTVAKALSGTSEATAIVPADTVFTVDYSYPAGVGFDAGSGTLDIRADGAVVTSPDVPVGAQITLTERVPAAIDGLEWGTPVITPSTFTADDSTTVKVVVTNPVAETLGGFSLVKSVSGTASGLVPAGTVFSVDYAWTTTDGKSGNGTVDVKAGGAPVHVSGIPGGAVVTLTEHAANPITGVQWLDPVFSENGFTVIAGKVVAINLDNPTQLRNGVIAIKKVLDGSGKALVPASAEFTVDYSYPAGDGFPAGKGTIVVKADGVVVTSDPIPYGAMVTLEEAVPSAVDGVTWTGAKFDVAELEVGDGIVSNVTLTNTYDTVPPTPTPTPSTTTPPHLSVTGFDGGPVALLFGIGILAVLAAGAMLFTARRRSADS